MERRRKKVFPLKGDVNTSMSFAVYANADRLLKHKHAWKVWHTLKEFGCLVYVVAPELKILEGSKIYPDLHSIRGKVHVVIPCLRAELLTDLVKEAAEIGAEYIWFQEKNWTLELDSRCQEKGIVVLRGCFLKHKVYSKPLAFFNPCYWHGRQENKVPSKYLRV